MIVADTGAIVALIDADDEHHASLRKAFERDPDAWIVPWVTLPEVDHLVSSRIGTDVARAFRQDVAEGAFVVGWGDQRDLVRAVELDRRYAALDLGLVDAVVLALAERLDAEAIATLDLRDFASVELSSGIELWPRDL